MNHCCDGKGVNRFVPGYAGYTEFTSSIPKLYWGVKSQEQRILALCEQLHKLICYADMLGEKINLNKDDIEELQALFEQFMESGFEDYYERQIYAWIDEHMAELIEQAVKMVFFGLNEQGYFVAYIPDGWDDLIFDTGMVYGKDTYGRLILRWDVDDSGESVNQRPEDWS